MTSIIGKMLAAVRGTADQRPPVSYAPPGAPMAHGLLGMGQSETRLMDTYGSVGTIFAIVSLLARSTAAVEWRLYRRQSGPRPQPGAAEDDGRTEVTQHAALDLLARPNPWYTQFEFVEQGQQHLDLTGEQWWVVVRAGSGGTGVPLSMWPVRPDRMQPVPDPARFIAGYLYTSPSGEDVALDVGEVIWTRYPHPTDPYRGLGPVQAILTDLDASRYAAEWNRNFFLNSAEPGGLIEVEQELTDDEFTQLTSRWRDAHQGVARAHRVAVLEMGAKWRDRAFSQRDMQFTELRNVSRDVIREAFRVNQFMLGTTTDVNLANANAAQAVFERGVLTERLDRLRDTLNARLLPMFYPGVRPGSVPVEFDYCSPVGADRAADNAEIAAKSLAAFNLARSGYDLAAITEAVGLPPMAAAPRPVPPTAAGPEPDGPPPGVAGDPSGDGLDALLRSAVGELPARVNGSRIGGHR